ncbi:TonB-dependent receptor [Povalibacter sp.]|uniref:TonB-dependent receptor n=1 Tax=Povalibacter sp. TaxID=1962978 RepID=UPI002F3F43EE
MRHRFNKSALLAAAAVASTTPMSAAYAQDGISAQLEEITVTARRRDENLMQVPVAISAVGAAEIESSGVKSMIELAEFTPGLHASVGGAARGDRSSMRLTFRGLSVAAGLSFIDGAPYAGSRAPDVLDFERVEVLKGPQSAYFGRSTFAGAVNFVTKSPSDTFQGRVRSELTNFDGSDTSLTLEGPLSDTLGVRVNARHYSFGGYYENGGDPGSMTGGRSTESIAATFLWEPSEKFTARSLLSFTVDDDGSPTIAALKSGSELFCNLGGTSGGGLYHCGALPRVSQLDPKIISINDYMDPYTYGMLFEGGFNYPLTFNPTFNDRYGMKREVSVAHLKMDYEFDNGFALSSNSALHSTKFGLMQEQLYRDGRSYPNPNWGTNPNASAPYQHMAVLNQSLLHDFSQELRLTTPQSWSLRGTFGANYYKEWGPPGSNPGVSYSGLIRGSKQDRDVDTPAVFGGLYYDVTDTVTVGAEGRYQWDKITQHIVYPNQAPPLSETFTSFSPRVTVDWKFAPNSLVYALFSRGYQPGGFNAQLVGQPQYILDQVATAGSNISFEQEQLDNYEIGFKHTWLDNTLRTVVALYYSDWMNGQVTNSVFAIRTDNTLQPVGVTQNIGKVNLQGIELDAEYVFNHNFSVSANWNYADNEIKSYVYTPGGLRIRGSSNVTGNQLERTPKVSWAISPTFRADLNDEYELFARLDYRGRSRIFVDPTNEAWISPVNLFNLRGGISNDSIRIEAFINNLTNDDHIQEGLRANDVLFSNSTLNEIRLVLPDKRTYGVTLTYNF